MLWKIYFWIFSVITLIVILSFSRYIPWNLGDVLLIAGFILAIVTVYSYVYKRFLFGARVWKYIFWFNIITTLFDFLYTFTLLDSLFTFPEFLQSNALRAVLPSPYPLTDYLIGMLIVLPVYIANHRLAYPVTTTTRKTVSTKKKVVKKRKK
jgi:hypothetical protein